MIRARGFTLVEVMVALAVVAVALPALLMSLDQQVEGTGYLRDKSLAHMVAANKLTEIRLLAKSSQDLLKGKDSGVVEMADREWYWWVESKATEVDKFYRIAITVATEEEQRELPLQTLVAFMSADLTLEPEADPAADQGLEVGSGSGSGTGTGTGTGSRSGSQSGRTTRPNATRGATR